MPGWNFRSHLQLDKVVNQYMNDGKAPFSNELRKILDDDYEIPPHYTEFMDSRRPADDYVLSKLD